MLLKFFQSERQPLSFSHFIAKNLENPIESLLQLKKEQQPKINIIAYCLMPTHFHLAVETISLEAISKFSNDVLNSYSRYFNSLHNRKGPLWQSRSKKILCETDEQLLHLTRYIHLNPVTAYIVNKPEEWYWSSYHEYIKSKVNFPICGFKNRISIGLEKYVEFVNSNIEHQRKIAQ